MPAEYNDTIPMAYSVKLYDAWAKLPSGFYGNGREPDSEENTGACQYVELEAYEGWFWMVAHGLVSFWFSADNATVEEPFKHDDSWDGPWRPIHTGTALILWTARKRRSKLTYNHSSVAKVPY